MLAPVPRSGAAARLRLQEAALELFAAQGFERTTTAEIAARAGVNDRTFFRHFANKGEVLFDGEEDLRDALVRAVADAPPGGSPLDALHRAFERCAAIPEGRRAFAAPRWEVISANAALRERDAAKGAAMGRALARALVDRGVDERVAALAAQAGWAAFHQAMARWIQEPDADLPSCIRSSIADLRAIGLAGQVGAPAGAAPALPDEPAPPPGAADVPRTRTSTH